MFGESTRLGSRLRPRYPITLPQLVDTVGKIAWVTKSETIDPRIFIHGPYIRCPKCNRQGYGVVEIGGRGYTRRCRRCWYSSRYPVLSTLQKKVIYVDQFAISNMMEAIDVTAKAHDRAAADPFWLSLFEQLERVCKLQLAVCRESYVHTDRKSVV